MKKFIYVILLFSFLQITKVQATFYGPDGQPLNLGNQPIDNGIARYQAGLAPM